MRRATKEFVGPFNSWRNVKTYYSAKGDGVTDNTTAIQNALNDLRVARNNGWSVLYFPAGTYKITAELTALRQDVNNDYTGSEIVGADPSTTIIKWYGTSGGTMFEYDGWYSAVKRLTFDGSSSANIGIDQDPSFSTFVEMSDDWFENMANGLVLGIAQQNGQAEHLINRCHFINCSQYGVAPWNWNSLDEWCLHCLFQNCGTGVVNIMGNYHVYDSVFLNSSVCDCESNNDGPFTIDGNISIGSRTFIGGTGTDIRMPDNSLFTTFCGTPLLVTNNQVYDFTASLAVAYMGGCLTMMDNLFAPPSGTTGSVVEWDPQSVSPQLGSETLVGNSYTVPAYGASPGIDYANVVVGYAINNVWDGNAGTVYYDQNCNDAELPDFQLIYCTPGQALTTAYSYSLTDRQVSTDGPWDPISWSLAGSANSGIPGRRSTRATLSPGPHAGRSKPSPSAPPAPTTCIAWMSPRSPAPAMAASWRNTR